MNKLDKRPSDTTIDPEILEEVQRLTVVRLQSLSKDIKISVGDAEFSQEDAIEHVEQADEIGQQVMAMQLEFLQDLATGDLYRYE